MKKLRINNCWILFLFFSLFIGLTGCKSSDSDDKANVETKSNTTEQAKAVKQSEFLKPGQSAAYGDLEVTLLSVKKTSEYINGPKAGHVYGVLRFRVKNNGKEDDSAMIISDIQWKDNASGMRDGYVRTTGVKLDNPKDYNLAPGAGGEFEEVYTFPENLQEAEFHLMKGYNPKEIARWMMPIY